MPGVQTTSNLERLIKAGIVPLAKGERLSSDKLRKIERLSRAEIEMIIRIHKKVGRVVGCNFI